MLFHSSQYINTLIDIIYLYYDHTFIDRTVLRILYTKISFFDEINLLIDNRI